MNTWKRWISAALAAALLLSSVPAGAIPASEAEAGGSGQKAVPIATEEMQELTYQVPDTNIVLTYTVADGTATITGCNEDASGVLTIPQEIDSVPVTAIGENAFSSHNNLIEGLTEVIIPEGVTTIGFRAFYGADDIAKVSLPKSLLSIDSQNFTSPLLTSAGPAGDGNDYAVEFGWRETIPDGGFQSFTALKNAVIPEGITEIGIYAFARTDLQEISLPSSLRTIGTHAFFSTDLTALTIPEGVTQVGAGIVANCAELSSLYLPSTLTEIGERYGDSLGDFRVTKLASAGPAGSGCNLIYGWTATIPDNAFAQLPIQQITLPEGLQTIGRCAFSYTHIQGVDIPDGVTEIGNLAFSNCSELSKVMIPDSVQTLSASFSDCEQLTSAGSVSSDCNIELGWVTEIPANAFSGMDSLTSVNIPEGITTLGRRSFYNCDNLAKVYLPSTLTTAEDAFTGCDGLETAGPVGSGCNVEIAVKGTLPASLFAHSTSLRTVALPETITAIGNEAFSGCTALETVSLSGGLTSIGNSAFSDCTALQTMILPGELAAVGAGAFSGCTELVDVSLPSGVTSLGSRAFAGCTSLTEITLPTGITQLSGTFEGAGLTYISVPDGVTRVDSGAFQSCANLTYAVLPATLERLDVHVFDGCNALLDIYFLGTIAQWEALTGSWTAELPDAVTVHCTDGDVGGSELAASYLTAVFTDYDVESGQVTLDGGTVTQYQVTEQTDTAFLDQLEALRGHDVLVHVAPTTDPWVWEIRSIVPVELHRGTLNAVDDASITLGGATYANHLAQYGRENPDILGQFMLYYVLDGAVVDYTLLTHETGSLRAWTVEDGEMTSVTIGEREYPARLDKPLFEASGSSAGLGAEYWIADGTIYAITLSSSSEDIYETKKLASYDAALGTAVFSDGTQYKASLSEEQQALIGQWVTVTKQSADAERITGLKKAVPELVLEITAQDEGDIYRKDGKYSYQETGPFESASSFEIGYQVRVTNSFPYASAQALEEMAQDPSLDLQVEDFRVRAPRDFNFGWTGGGEAGIEKSFLLHAGESLSGEGYVRPGLWYSPDAERDSLLITCAAETAAGGLQAVQDGFTIVDLDYEPPAASEDIEEQDKQIEASSEEAAQNFAVSDAQIILNPNTMRELFGIQGERLDAFKLELLTAVLMSSAPEKTFQEELDDAVLEKFFGKYKTDLTASSYTVPLTYQIQSPEYGLLTVTFECQVHGYSLSDDGIPYALDAAIGYEVVQQEENAPKHLPEDLRQDGQLGQIAAYDVERFAQSAYDVAEAEIKKHVYMDTWGNTANEVATILLDDTVQDILEANETTFADEFWKLIVWPTKEFTNACPTDLFIYDQNGDLKGAVEDGNITLDSTEFYLSVEDDVKTVRYLEDGYTIRYEATADGVMDVEVTEYLDANTPLRRVAFYQVPLSAGDVYEQVISTELLPDAAAYQLEKDDGSTYLPDDDERLFILHSDTEEEGGGSGSSGGGSGGGSGSSAGTPVTVAPVSHGKVTVTPQHAAQGSTVTITAEPEDGYRLQSLTVTDSQGKAIPVIKAADGTYTFTMPETDSVNVEAAFVPDVPGSTVEPFHDVDADAWYADAVQYVYEQGLMQGTDAGLFSPEEPVNRGMVVTILYRLAGSPETDASMGFSDVEPDAYYADAVRWASSAGIVTGYSAAAFGPEDTITREQLAAMLYRYVCAQGISVFAEPLVPQAFTDVSSISDYAAEAMAWAVDTGLMAGMPDGRLAPDGSATRAQTAVILMRLDEYLDTANQQP